MKKLIDDIKHSPAFAGLVVSLFILPLLFCFRTENTFELPKLAFFVLSLGVVSCLWLLQCANEKKITLLKTPLGIGFLIFFAANLVSLVNTLNLVVSSIAIIRLCLNILLFYLVINIVKTKNQIITLSAVIFIAASIQAVYGIFQYYGHDPLFGQYIAGIVEQSRFNAVIGTLGYKNYIGGFLVMVLPVSVFIIANQKSYIVKALASLAAISILIAIVLSRTRGAWIGLVAALLIMGWPCLKNIIIKCVPNRHTYIIVFTIILVGGIAGICLLGFSDKGDPLSSLINNEMVQRRLVIWRTAISMAKTQPFIGTGPGMFKVRYLEFLGKNHGARPSQKEALLAENVKEPHNEYLQQLSEVGLFGLAGFLFLLLTICGELIHALKKIGEKNDRLLLLALLSSIVAVLVHSFFSFPLRVLPTSIYFWTVVGLGFSVIHQNDPYKKREYAIDPERCHGIALLIVAAALVATYFIFVGDMRFARALEYSRQGDIKNSLKTYQKMSVRRFFDYRLKYHYGAALLAVGKVEEGIEQLEKAKTGYNDVNLYTNLGKAYLESNQYEKSASAYAFAVATGINQVDNLNNLGVVRVKQSKYKIANQLFKRAVWLDPKAYQSNYNLALSHINLKQFNEAVKRLGRCLKVKETIEVNNLLGVCYLQNNDYTSALKYFERNLQIETNPVQTLNNLGALYLKMGQKDNAIKSWKKVLDIDPDNDIANRNLRASSVQ